MTEQPPAAGGANQPANPGAEHQGTALITGTSTGIGYATSLLLAQRGYRVYAAMRDLAKAEALRSASLALNLPIEFVEIDVSDENSVAAGIDRIAESEPIDVLVNNAGISGASSLEDTSMAEHKAIFETNYFGTVRCIRSVVGSMRARGTGTIVNVSSAAGLFATPTQIPYSASKWAIECLSEALAHELAPHGVRVTCIEPGVVATNIFANSKERSHYDPESPYAGTMRRIGKIFAAGLKQPATPEMVAETILASITAPEYQLRWPVGGDAEKFAQTRTTLDTERWIDIANEPDEAVYNEGFERLFGITI